MNETSALVASLTEAKSPSAADLPHARALSEPCAESYGYTLDDLAALLVQLEPDNQVELVRLQQEITNLANSPQLIDAARRPLGEAVQQIARLGEAASRPQSHQWDQALAEIQHLVETALRAEAHGEAVPAPTEVEPSRDAAGYPVALLGELDAHFLREFITESRENIEQAEAALLKLETDPSDLEAINVVFRAFHTMKGVATWLGLLRIAELSHHAETLLSRIREREIQCTGPYADLALRSCDLLKELLQIKENALAGAPLYTPPGYLELIKELSPPKAAKSSSAFDEQKQRELRQPDSPSTDSQAASNQEEGSTTSQDDRHFGLTSRDTGVTMRPQTASALPPALLGAGKVETSVRVRTERLDQLIDLVGELVIAQSMVTQDATVLDRNQHELARKVAHAGKLVRELQDLSMSMRMVPLKPTFQKMSRVVRDLAQKSGKQVQLLTEGEETEIDRNMVDVINDPLIHMVRNAVDHGLETPDERTAKGKPALGTIRLSAFHSNGNVVIELSEDGRGLNRQKILAKAVAKGLLATEKELTDNQVYNLIFEPGFSTAEKITDISGRGVGMDVVRRKIEGARGRIEIASTPHQGTTFLLHLPLTLAITDGMLVKVGSERYIIPTSSIQVSLRPTPEQLLTVAGRGEMLNLRGEMLPIFRLHRLFSIANAITTATNGLLVVVDDGVRRCALLVDDLLSKQQVVAKALGEGLRIQGITGGAILGDGSVGLILDTAEILALARQGQASGSPPPTTRLAA
jgi:two-component system, chemotaxis family, sensor kinase CheA